MPLELRNDASTSNNNDDDDAQQQPNVIDIVSISDVWSDHMLPYFTFRDIARCEQVFRFCFNRVKTWEFLCQRDFSVQRKHAPDASFRMIRHNQSWKQVYESWHTWHCHTHHVTTTEQCLDAIRLFQDIEAYWSRHRYEVLRHSFLPGLDTTALQAWAQHPAVPSDLVAWLAVCGGESTATLPWAGFLGCSRYRRDARHHSLQLVDAKLMQLQDPTFTQQTGVLRQSNDSYRPVMVARSAGGLSSKGLFLSVRKDPIHDPHGRHVLLHEANNDNNNVIMVGTRGILHYLQQYVQRLKKGTFKVASVVPETPSLRGIDLFPDAGNAVSVSVVHSIEVRASARWFPTFNHERERERGLSFDFSIRIRMIRSAIVDTFQLVSSHLEVVNGHGAVRHVDEESVLRKQPLFFFYHDVHSFGYHTVGLLGIDDTYPNMVFVHHGGTGPVAGTTVEDTNGAHVRGVLRFVPGSIDQPQGPPFDVTIEPFSLEVFSPVY